MLFKSNMFRHLFVAFLCQTCTATTVTCKTKCPNQSAYAEVRLFSNAVKCVGALKNFAKRYNDMVATIVACTHSCSSVKEQKNDSGLLFMHATLERHACRSFCQRKLLAVPDTPEQLIIEFANEISYDSLHRSSLQNVTDDLEGGEKDATNKPSDRVVYKDDTNHTAVCEQAEEVVSSMFESLERCRGACTDERLPSNPSKKFSLPFTRYAVSELKCKIGCLTTLLHFDGVHHSKVLSEAYQNVQICYYYSTRIEEACWYTQPQGSQQNLDDLMRATFTDQQFRIQQEWSLLRKEVMQYLEPLLGERKQWVKLKALLMEQLSKTRADLGESEHGTGITVTHNAEQLKGTLRFQAEGFVTEEECDTLVHMAQNVTTGGDGYRGDKQPFTKFELFKGFTPSQSPAKLVEEGRLKREELHLVLTLAERVRTYMMAYFQLERELYYSYTHIVCREALPDQDGKREDMSHPIHGDNCIYNSSSGQCFKNGTAYTWRDFSSIVFLNDDIEGGEFIFGRSKDDIDAKVVPKCGRAVGFSSENLHGVLPLTKGKRCVLALWFTFDPAHREILMDAAKAVFKT